MEERLLFCEIQNIESIACVLGLSFPDTANDFQKAFLTMAHLVAACREYVLKGVQVPLDLLHLLDKLNMIVLQNEYKQI